MVTGKALREELVHWGLVVLGEGLGTSAASYIEDTERLNSISMASSAFDGAHVRIADSGAGEDGEQTRVDYLDVDNGRLHVTPDLTGGLSTGEDYEIWLHGIDPDDVDRYRDEALTSICSSWQPHPLSEVTNAGYLDTLSASNWEAYNSGTIAIQSSIEFPSEFARRALRVTGDGASANGSAESVAISVRPNQQFYLYVPVSARTGTAAVWVLDETNTAEISLSGTATATGRGWVALQVTGTIPSGCYEIVINIGVQGSSDSADFGPINFHWDNQKFIGIENVVSKDHIGSIYSLTNAMDVGSNILWGEEDADQAVGFRVQQINDKVAIRFQEGSGMLDRPYFYEARTYYDDLSAGYLTIAQRVTGYAASTTCPT
ncbi:hypothetical protein LCGC14_1584690, partial [marine sediment metagenome]